MRRKHPKTDRLTLLFGLLALSFLRAADVNVSGAVYNKATGLSLANVNVIILDSHLGAATDENGFFLIRGVQAGDYTILVTAIGYEESYRDITVPLNELLEFSLAETFFQMDDVVVTGTRTERIHSNAPVATEVISRQDILESGARDMAELLEERAGVSVSASVEGGKVISLLGMDAKYILVMIDGQPITGKFNSRINLDQVSTAIIDKVEIIKGPSSSLYGSEAMGGVINIITKRNIFVKPLTAYVRYSGGLTPPVKESFNPVDFDVGKRDVRMNLNLGRKSLVLHSDLDFLKANVDRNLQYIDVDNYDKLSFRSDLMWTINDRHELKFNGSQFINDEMNHTTLLDGQTIIDRKSISGEHKWSISRQWQLQTILREDQYARRYKETRPQSGEIVKREVTQESQDELEINAIYETEKRTLSLGTEIRRETYSNARVSGGDLLEQKSTALFAQVEQGVTQYLTLVVGFRVDNNNEVQEPVFSPRLAAMYVLSDRYKLRASWGKGFRMPSFMDKYMNWNHWQFGYAIIGNPDLIPERSNGYSLGLEYYNPGRYKFSATIYRNIFDNMIIDDQLEPGLFTYSNIDRVNFTGLEVQHRRNISRSWTASVAYNLSRNRNVKTGELVPNSPEHSANIRLSFKSKSGRFSSALKVKAAAPYKVNLYIPVVENGENAGYFDIRDREGFFLVDIDAKLKVHRLATFSYGVRNIFDVVDIQYGPFIGRTMYIELITKLGGY